MLQRVANLIRERLEMLAQNAALDVVVAPVGGGGLIGGIGCALKALAPDVEVVGVQSGIEAGDVDLERVGRPELDRGIASVTLALLLK